SGPRNCERRKSKRMRLDSGALATPVIVAVRASGMEIGPVLNTFDTASASQRLLELRLGVYCCTYNTSPFPASRMGSKFGTTITWFVSWVLPEGTSGQSGSLVKRRPRVS